MPKKLRPFQRELKEREDDRARIERELKLRQRIFYRFAELSEKERKRRFAFLIAEKQRQCLRNLRDDGELDSDSSSDAETTVPRSLTQPEENLLSKNLQIQRIYPRFQPWIIHQSHYLIQHIE